MSQAYVDVHGPLEPLVALAAQLREQRRLQAERDANRSCAAMCLGPNVTVARALYRGRSVPREALDPRYRDRLVCWDGVLTDDIVLDVLVLLEADRLAGEDLNDAPPPPWLRTARRAA